MIKRNPSILFPTNDFSGSPQKKSFFKYFNINLFRIEKMIFWKKKNSSQGIHFIYFRPSKAIFHFFFWTICTVLLYAEMRLKPSKKGKIGRNRSLTDEDKCTRFILLRIYWEKILIMWKNSWKTVKTVFKHPWKIVYGE